MEIINGKSVKSDKEVGIERAKCAKFLRVNTTFKNEHIALLVGLSVDAVKRMFSIGNDRAWKEVVMPIKIERGNKDNRPLNKNIREAIKYCIKKNLFTNTCIAEAFNINPSCVSKMKISIVNNKEAVKEDKRRHNRRAEDRKLIRSLRVKIRNN